jgi:hypothetical protein
MDKRVALARLLRNLAQCVESSAGEEVEGLLTGENLLRIEARTPVQTKPVHQKSLISQDRESLAIAERLRGLPSREEGHRLLDELSLKRRGLEHLARAMGLPVSKDDNVERLRLKVIESSIGSRLASQAIRGQ